MHPYIHSRATYSCQDMKTTSVSINRQIGKAGTALTHTHTMKYSLACLLSHVRLCDPTVISRAKGAFFLLLLFNLKKLEKDQFEIKVANRPEATNFRNKTPNGQK